MNENFGIIIFYIVIVFSLFLVLIGITMLLMEKRRIHKRNKITTTVRKKQKTITEQEIDAAFSRLETLEQSMKNTANAYVHWIEYWKALFIACRKHNVIWTNREDIFHIAPPATEEDLVPIEKELGSSIPENFRSVLLKFSSKVSIRWWLNDDDEAPLPINNVSWGECCWKLQDLPAIMEGYNGWVSECFSNPDDSYDAVWHNKFPIIHIVNGDIIAIDLASPEGTIVYLSHDDGEGHGYILGSNFSDFIERHSLIGCPGYEEWLLTPFAPNKTLDPDCKNAIAWRKWFGLEINSNEQ